MCEEWRAIEGYEGLYEVSDAGNIRSLRYGKNVKQFVNNSGYYRVHIYDREGTPKNHSPHRLIAKAFCEGYEDGLIVNHRDGNRLNNKASNLEWVTYSFNNRDTYARGSNSGSRYWKRVDMLDVEGNLLRTFDSQREASKVTGIQVANISAVCRGLRKSAGGYVWRFSS